jgi:hypothetical protein
MNYGDIFTFDNDTKSINFLSAREPFRPTNFKTMKVPIEYVGKPWVFAYVYYGNHSLWWAIAKANDLRMPLLLRDVFRVRYGHVATDNIVTDFYLNRTIIVPSIEDIEEYVAKISNI